MGTVYRNFGNKPIKLSAIPTRIFGVGLHKTATTSLHKAFQVLGFDSLHWGRGEAPLIWDEMQSVGRLSLIHISLHDDRCRVSSEKEGRLT